MTLMSRARTLAVLAFIFAVFLINEVEGAPVIPKSQRGPRHRRKNSVKKPWTDNALILIIIGLTFTIPIAYFIYSVAKDPMFPEVVKAGRKYLEEKWVSLLSTSTASRKDRKSSRRKKDEGTSRRRRTSRSRDDVDLTSDTEESRDLEKRRRRRRRKEQRSAGEEPAVEQMY